MESRKWAYDELDDERQQLLEPGQHLLLVAPEDGVQDVRHFGQDVDVILVLGGWGDNQTSGVALAHARKMKAIF